ncbi:hypothetical protein HQ865_04510 [Mucilaginibacter mali]|uniref:Uncharacterized protein n=1 Tax=Mucilaginibacter mali TaxID=2740462 RepID=A0A7D4PSJ9_9SPHI|nr:hypothetical protein [Mucilaginibacter mali]QKJ29043.1 hypothetical protein HQ865_04510 [Mucilaginibacter mali]
MKSLKIMFIALVAVFTFSAANAQVRVHATIGTPPPHHRVVVVHRPPYHPRTVVVRRPAYHHRVVVVHRPVHHYYRRPYYRHH